MYVQAQKIVIEKWLNGKESATVLTFDDWSPGQGSIAVPLCIQKNIPATFFIMTEHDWTGGGFPQMDYAAANGLEIGNHTTSHPKLTTIDSWKLNQEINVTKTFLETKVPNQKEVLTFCYPHGDYNQTVLNKVKEKHIAARIFEETYDKTFTYEFAKTEDDYYRVQEIRVNSDLTPILYKKWMQHGIDNNALMIFTFHSVYNNAINDSWYDEVSESYLTTFIDDVKSYQQNTWITTFADAIRYHKEAHCSKINVVSNNGQKIVFELTDTLSNNTIYNIPLSLTLSKEKDFIYTKVSQNGASIPFTKNKDGNITFNVVPDKGEITIEKEYILAIEQNQLVELSIAPNPVEDVLFLSQNIEEGIIVNSLGQVVLTAKNTNQLTIYTLEKGMYVLCINHQKIRFVKE